jgi:hypothetical protein
MVGLMATKAITSQRVTPLACANSYNIAEQWLSTYRMSNNPRHLETARICFVIADELYSKSFDKILGWDETARQRIRLESRGRVIELFAALGYTSRVVDDRDVAVVPVEGSGDLSP